MKIFEPNQKQNLVVLMEPPIDQFDISLKGGNMILNRFCIDEDAAFELSGVYYFKTSGKNIFWSTHVNEFERQEKGNKYSFWRSHFILLT